MSENVCLAHLVLYLPRMMASEYGMIDVLWRVLCYNLSYIDHLESPVASEEACD